MSKTAHVWTKLKGIPWMVCRACGLVWLRNPLTARCVREGCEKD